MNGRLGDVVASVRHLPDRRGWLRVAAELLWAMPLLLLIAYAGGLARIVEPPDSAALLQLGATLLVAPALGEELLFRAAIIPRERPRWPWLAFSVVLFVAWHPLQVVTFGPPWAGAFLDPWFLFAVAVLGVALARIYAVAGSIWPCVLAHWLVVFVWKVLLGGPF